MFLDEIFKSNSAILNSLLTLINERLFYNNSTPVESPLVTLVGASNEFPEEDEGLEAMYDRLLLRYVVEEIKDKRNFVLMLKDEGSDVQIPHITMDEMLEIHKFVEEVEVPDKIYEDLAFIHQDLADEGIRPSARRMKNAVKALKAKAFIRGSDIVEEDDLEILNDILWDEPHEREEVSEVVKRYAKDTLSIILDEQEEVIMDIIKQVDEAGDDVNVSIEAISKLKSVAFETKVLIKKYLESEDKINKRIKTINKAIEEVTDSSLLSLDVKGTESEISF